jgi:S1-C subfamily serine protease
MLFWNGVAEEQAEFEGELRYAGIGAKVREVPEGGLITQVARLGPAEDAGLRPRDLIWRSDERSLSAISAVG